AQDENKTLASEDPSDNVLPLVQITSSQQTISSSSPLSSQGSYSFMWKNPSPPSTFSGKYYYGLGWMHFIYYCNSSIRPGLCHNRNPGNITAFGAIPIISFHR